MTRWVTALWLWLLLGASGASVWAADFKTHYDLAMALYQAQRYEDAIPEFKAAYEREPKPGLLFNLAQSYRKAGHPREAIEYYDRYLSSEPKLDNEMRRKVDGYLAEARNTLAALELEMKQRLAEEKAAREREREPAPSTVAPDPTAGPGPAVSPTAVSPTAVSPTVAGATASRTDPAISRPPSEPSRASPVYRRWWFWTAIGGGVAAAAIITGVVLATRSTGYPAVPTGVPRVVLMF
ncbi:MAG TPA: tetratricopeptide repeat protein [Pseudomonadota bacterium]|nr:tetratricopeptide repeat protein [Pseudomonadota bacterium]